VPPESGSLARAAGRAARAAADRREGRPRVNTTALVVIIDGGAADLIRQAGRTHEAAKALRVKPSGDEVTLLRDVVAPVVDVQASAGATARRAPVQRVLPLPNVTAAPMHAAPQIPASVTVRELDRGVA
jgi:hypothetical protein